MRPDPPANPSLAISISALCTLATIACRLGFTPAATPTALPSPSPTTVPSPSPDLAIIDRATLPRVTRLASVSQSWPNAIAWSPDGSMLAIADMDGAWFRDGRSLEILDHIDFTKALRPDVVGSTVWTIAYSPTDDIVATDVSGSNFHILLWHPGDSTPWRRLLGHDDSIRDLVFTPDGTRLISASEDASVKVWDVAGGSQLCDLQNHWDWVDSLDISADGTRLVSTGFDAIINIWDPYSCELLVALQDEYIIDSVAISPDASLIAAGERDTAIHIFDQTGDFLRLLVGHGDWTVYDLDFGVRGDILASAGEDGTVRFWDPQTGTILRTIDIGSELTSARFSPDGHSIAIASGAGQRLEIWGLPPQ